MFVEVIVCNNIVVFETQCSFGDTAMFKFWRLGLRFPVYGVISTAHVQNQLYIYFRVETNHIIWFVQGRLAYSISNF